MTSPLVIAEIGVNHNGDLGLAREMVAAAAASGADYVKFQAFRAADLVAEGCATADYQAANTGLTDQHALLRRLELGMDDFADLARRCATAGTKFLCTSFSADMTAGLVGLGMDRIKIASGELTNRPALVQAAGFGLPVLLSTGMADLDEIAEALGCLAAAGARDVTLLHCTSLYPAPDDTINLRAMATMRARFGLPVGYSDHSDGAHVAVAATALGATVIEKHFTLDRGLPGPDHRASLPPDEFARMVAMIRATALALGDGRKVPTPAERDVAALVRRSWHAAVPIAAGATINAGDVDLRRPASGLPPAHSPVGRRAAADIAAGSPVAESALAPAVPNN